MRVFRPYYRSLYCRLVPLLLAVLLCACGNKGDLVRPTPSADQQQKAATPAADVEKPAQDSAQH